MVTHDLLGAADVADRIGFIAGGRLVHETVGAGGRERFDVRALHPAVCRWRRAAPPEPRSAAWPSKNGA